MYVRMCAYADICRWVRMRLMCDGCVCDNVNFT